MRLHSKLLLCLCLCILASCGPNPPNEQAQDKISASVDAREIVLDAQLHLKRRFEVMFDEYKYASNSFQRELYANMLNGEFDFLGIDFTSYRAEEQVEEWQELIESKIKLEALQRISNSLKD